MRWTYWATVESLRPLILVRLSVVPESDREKPPVGMSLPLFVVAVATGLVFCLYIVLG